MKMMAGVLVVAVMMLTGCGAAPAEEQLLAEAAASSEQQSQTQELTVAGSCTVSLQCSNGSSVSCSGTNGACSASAANGGSVTCNSVPKNCGLVVPTCGCKSDGCCSQFCAFDPDCS
jgi:hypothetical protein